MSSSFNWDQFEIAESKQEQPFNWENIPVAPSKLRSALTAPLKGILKEGQNINPLGLRGPIPPELANRIVEQFLPTNPEHEPLERAGKLAPYVAVGPEGLIPKGLQLAAGVLGGEIAKELGAGELGQSVAETGAMGIPGLAKSGIKKGLSLLKAPKEKLPSGIEKISAIEAKRPQRGIITPEQQEKTISKLNEQASKLTRESIDKKLPLAKQIEEGFDFGKQFEEGFGKLQQTAKAANPIIETKPISEFLSQTTEKYHGIPSLHPDAKKIMTEVSNLRKRPQETLSNLLKIYRSNNQKIRHIYETSRLTGKQGEFVDFLVNLNKNIGKSFENTFPKDSAWVNEFKRLNEVYKEFKDTAKTLGILDPILHQRTTPATLQRFGTDPKLQQKLKLSMGEEGANQIIQIAKDLKLAQDAIKKIPAREFKMWETVLPLGLFVPFIKFPAGFVAVKKAYDWMRRGYGLFLTTPKRRKIYNDALKNIIAGNRAGFLKAANDLKNEIERKGKEKANPSTQTKAQ